MIPMLGASGIGKHFATTLVGKGAKVVIGDINSSAGQELVDALNKESV